MFSEIPFEQTEMNQKLHNFSKEQSFKEAFTLHYRVLCYFAYRLVHDHDVAKDIVQDAYVAYWNQIHEIQSDEKVIKAYLYNAVKFISCKRIRHEKVVQRYSDSAQSAGEDSDINENIIRAEVLAEIHKALNNLPPNCREIFMLGYFEGLSNSKIAEVMEISINTVKTHKQRGFKILRNLLKPEMFILLLFFKE